MSVDKWAYMPDKCNGEPCPGDCDLCAKAFGVNGMHVKICGIPHKVVFVDDCFDSDATHMGQIDYGKCLIKINKSIPAELQEATLIHEILHGVLVHIGRHDLAEDETLVTSLATAMYPIFDVRGD